MQNVIGIGIGIPYANSSGGSAPPPVSGNILLEDGVNFIELEDASGVILLEG